MMHAHFSDAELCQFDRLELEPICNLFGRIAAGKPVGELTKAQLEELGTIAATVSSPLAKQYVETAKRVAAEKAKAAAAAKAGSQPSQGQRFRTAARHLLRRAFLIRYV
jgi:hypothetical protein